MVVCSMRDFEPRYRNESKKLSLCAAYGNWLNWALVSWVRCVRKARPIGGVHEHHCYPWHEL
jgi:hypothetical protein